MAWTEGFQGDHAPVISQMHIIVGSCHMGNLKKCTGHTLPEF